MGRRRWGGIKRGQELEESIDEHGQRRGVFDADS